MTDQTPDTDETPRTTTETRPTDEIEPMIPILPSEPTPRTDGGRPTTTTPERPLDTSYATEHTRDTEEIVPFVADLTERE